MRIGNLELETDLIFPAVAGYSDIGARMLAKRYGAGLTVTEMVSAKGLVYGNENTASLLVTHESEDIKAVQLFGREPEFIARAIESPLLDKFHLIDLNCGCPVPKLVNNGEGSALMREPPLVYEIVKAAVGAAKGRPVTVKMRAGFSPDKKNAPMVARAAEEGGAAAVTVHGRTRDMMYSGNSDNGIIAEVKRAVSIPVIGNGDVTDLRSYIRMKEETLCDGVAIARGALGRPYIFSEIRGIDAEYHIPKLIRDHIAELIKYFPQRTVVNDIKKQIVFYTKGMRGAKELKEKVFRASYLDEVMDEIAKFERLYL